MNYSEYDNQDHTLVFLHMQKTAGTSMQFLLRSYHRRDRTFVIYPGVEGSKAELRALPGAEKADIDLLLGHFSYGIHELLPRPAQYVTILRHPTERVMSQYYHEKREESCLLHEPIRDGMKLGDYVEYYADFEMDNLQTRMLAGNWDLRGFGPCTDEMLEAAKENLRSGFSVVGLTERFDETYVLLKRVLGWRRFRVMNRRNVTNNRPQREDISRSTLSLIRERNQFDLALYQFATELFEEQIRSQGPEFAKDLTLYREIRARRQTKQSVLSRLYWRLRRYSVRTFIKERFTTVPASVPDSSQ